ncbi:hypothetical protein [Martelella alba]|uniref:Uncharacterized protein n=1 Tax=Martelella alba TaxID=2590451 RepID=A0ABY2SHX7_9HYPH|nr:hypothetical protein [Martelella alba]TKI04074.1 hypothetical protein FCN80_19115 [Martelella alba]
MNENNPAITVQSSILFLESQFCLSKIIFIGLIVRNTRRYKISAFWLATATPERASAHPHVKSFAARTTVSYNFLYALFLIKPGLWSDYFKFLAKFTQEYI